MKYVKKISLLALALLLSLGVFCACSEGGDTNKTSTTESDVESESSTTTGTDTVTVTEAETDAVTESIMKEPSTYTETNLDTFDSLLIHGRTLPPENGRLVLEWSWSGFTLRGWFDGPIAIDCLVATPLSILLHVAVDGEDTLLNPITAGEQSVILAEVERGYHTITVRKTSEGSIGTLTVRGLRFSGAIDTPPQAPSLTVEIIGDSITNGLGSYPEAITEWHPILQSDAYYSYSTMLGQALDAEVRLVAMSGWGVTHGSVSPDHRIPDIYHLASPIADPSAEWDFSVNRPDVVIIALGTNDVNTPSDVFATEAMRFLETVREKNPDAYIVWMYGMMDSRFSVALRTEIRRLNDDRVVYLRASLSQSGGWGHPTYEAQCGYAEALAELLEPVIGELS